MSTDNKSAHAFVRFPNEPPATLSVPGGTDIQFGCTFLRQLNGLLAGIKLGDFPYSRDFAEFRTALEQAETDLLDAGRPQTDDERTTLLDRYHKRGYGYWSSWMDEACPWGSEDDTQERQSP